MSEIEPRSREQRWPSAGPCSVLLSEDGHWLVIEFLHIEDHARSIEVAIPASTLPTLRAALDQLASALADPASGVRLGSRH